MRRAVEETMPPITTVASGRCTSEPGPTFRPWARNPMPPPTSRFKSAPEGRACAKLLKISQHVRRHALGQLEPVTCQVQRIAHADIRNREAPCAQVLAIRQRSFG